MFLLGLNIGWVFVIIKEKDLIRMEKKLMFRLML